MKPWERLISESNTYGKLISLIGFLLGAPLLTVPFFPEEARFLPAFLIPSLFSILFGLFICWRLPARERSVSVWQSSIERGSVPVIFAWFYAFFMGAMPFFIGGQLSFLHSLFEAVSGWTTTGMTVADIEELPRIFLFHRSFMQFCGGLGFIILIAMLVHWKQSMSLYNAEGHPDRIRPSLQGTARIIFLLYTGCLLIGTFLFALFGMGWFDALNHAMTALSTAGSSTRDGNISEFRSVAIELVTIILMLIGSSNFALLLLVLRRKFRQVFLNSEFRLMLQLLLAAIPLIAWALMDQLGATFSMGLRDAAFGVVAAISTTGFLVTDYFNWPPFALGLLLLLMHIGGSAGSTAGGIKLARAHLLVKITKESIHRRMAPARQVRVPTYQRVSGKIRIDEALVEDTFGFVATYIFILIAGTLLLTLSADATLFEAFFEFSSAFSTVGISGGLTSASANFGTLLIQMIAMILGRLEIFIVFIACYSMVHTWKKRFKN